MQGVKAETESALRAAIAACGPAASFAETLSNGSGQAQLPAPALAWLASALLTATATQPHGQPSAADNRDAVNTDAAVARIRQGVEHAGFTAAQPAPEGSSSRTHASGHGPAAHALPRISPAPHPPSHAAYDSLSDTHASVQTGSPPGAACAAPIGSVAEQPTWRYAREVQTMSFPCHWQQTACASAAQHAPVFNPPAGNQCSDWRVKAPASMTEEQLESSIAQVLASGMEQQARPAPRALAPVGAPAHLAHMTTADRLVRDGSSTSIKPRIEAGESAMATTTDRVSAHRAMLSGNRAELQRAMQAVHDAKRRMEAPDEAEEVHVPQPKRPRAITDDERRERRLRSNRESARRARARTSAHVAAQNNLISTLQRQVAEHHAALEASTNDVTLLHEAVHEWKAQHQAACQQVQQQTNVLDMLHRVCNSATAANRE